MRDHARQATRDLATAQHEAAHVVVALTLGLRVTRAVVGGEDARYSGWTALLGRDDDPMAWAVTHAAGIAYEAVAQGLTYRRALVLSVVDYDILHAVELVGGRALRTCVRSADAILHSRAREHARIARVLADRDITGADALRAALRLKS